MLEYNNKSTQSEDSEEKGDTESAIKPYDVVIIGSGPRATLQEYTHLGPS